MKYDEMERVEQSGYPKDNIVIAKGKKRDLGKGLNVAVGASIIGAGVAVVTLGTTLIGMAANGVLAQVFTSLF